MRTPPRRRSVTGLQNNKEAAMAIWTEHVLPRVLNVCMNAKHARRQDRWEPLHSRLAGGCKVTREFPGLIERAGFDLKGVEQYYMPGDPKYAGYMSEGSAIKA